MKNTASRKAPKASKAISGWDDAVFDPAALVRDMKDVADRYEGKKKLTLRAYSVAEPAPKFTPKDIAKLRQTRNLSRPLFAPILNLPTVTVRKRESGEQKPSGAALRLLEIMQRHPDALFR